MKFIVVNYRVEDDTKPPIEGAVREMVKYSDARTCSEEEFDRDIAPIYEKGPWRSQGTNHRVLANGHIARDMEPREEWVVDIDINDLARWAGQFLCVYYVDHYELPIIEIGHECD